MKLAKQKQKQETGEGKPTMWTNSGLLQRLERWHRLGVDRAPRKSVKGCISEQGERGTGDWCISLCYYSDLFTCTLDKNETIFKSLTIDKILTAQRTRLNIKLAQALA
jgi:hypothetical protein